MSIEKSKLKLLWTNEWGNKFDDLKERGQRELNEARGMQRGVLEAMKAVNALVAHADKDLEMVEAGEVPPETKRPMPRDLEDARYAKFYLARCVKALENLSQKFVNEEMIAHGRISMADDMVNFAKKQFDSEQARIEAWEKALREGSVVSEDGGEMPLKPGEGARIIALDPERRGVVSAAEDIRQRKAEAQREKAAKAEAESQPPDPKPEAEEQTTATSEVATEEPPAEQPKKGRRRSSGGGKKTRRKSKSTNGVNTDAPNS